MTKILRLPAMWSIILSMLILPRTCESATTHIINFGGVLGFAFSPSSLTIGLGDTLQWQGDFSIHPLSSTTIPAGAATWLVTTGTVFNYVVQDAGTYNYQCNIHFIIGMIGSFTTADSLTAPLVLLPPDNVTGVSTSPRLTWNSVSGAASYQVQNSTLGDFSIMYDTTIADTFLQLSSLNLLTKYFWHVRAINNVTIGAFSQTSTYTTAPSFSGELTSGWNLLSVPFRVADPRVSEVYPSAASHAFSYRGSYLIKDTLVIGQGYWVKFASPQSFPISGDTVSADTISVFPGWNLVGSISTQVPVSSIISNPPGIAASHFYRYATGYQVSDTISPGRGYWVKVKEAGELILSAHPVISPLSHIKIISSDEMPPPPPSYDASETLLPSAYALEQNYPNPFNPSTLIKYQLPFESNVTLGIYNLLGQRLLLLVEGIQSPGFKSIEWNAANYVSGIYFYKLEAISMGLEESSFLQVKKMTLVK